MNTVDALNVLGKALCGDSFEVKPGLTDAETILEIAKNYEGGSGSGGGSDADGLVIRALNTYDSKTGNTTIEYEQTAVGLGLDQLFGASVRIFMDSWDTLWSLARVMRVDSTIGGDAIILHYAMDQESNTEGKCLYFPDSGEIEPFSSGGTAGH